MLKSILIVTFVVRQITAVEPVYRQQLHYRTVAEGSVTPELVQAWDTPGMSGRRFVLMQPASGAEVYLRFIEGSAMAQESAALTTHGWNAAELLVTDPDQLAFQLRQSAFEVIGPPKDLYPRPKSPRAMQVKGPTGEILYMTRFDPAGSKYALGSATTLVDRVFIAVVGGPSMIELRHFYGDILGLPLSETSPMRISVLARANNLPIEMEFPLALAPLPKDFAIELDEYPSTTRPRPRPYGSLPPGMAMVTFLADQPDRLNVKWRQGLRPIGSPPYGGRRAGVTIGPAGEWIEVVEIPAAPAAPSAN
jgi:hypothetical protein